VIDIETLHLNKKKWYNGKRPKLQFDILYRLVLEGPISKGQAENIFEKAHSDIVQSFQKLETLGFIERNEKILGRGRPQHKFKITKNGLEALLNDEFTNALNFWKILYGYFAQYSQVIDENTLNTYFQNFFKFYFKYNNKQCIDTIDIFYNMSKKWMNDYVISQNMITPEQKVMEALSLYPKISFNELVKKSKLNSFAVCKVLNTHTMTFYPPRIFSSTRFILDFSENLIGKKNNKRYWNFVQHNLIKITKNSRGEKLYELSLFGIVLVFKLIRFLNGNNERKKIFFGNFTYFKYFEKIVSNYDTKLPLIFGKWNLLKRILKDYTICNFDKVISEYFFRQNNISISRGGNSEFFYSINEIILQTRQQLAKFVDAGHECFNLSSGCRPSDINSEVINTNSSNYLDTHYPLMNNPNLENITYLFNKCLYIFNLLNPVEQIIRNQELSYVKDSSINRENLLQDFEDLFADSITAFYYFNLHVELHFLYFMRTHWTKDVDVPPLSLKPKECLNQILKLDKNISNFCLIWYEDIINLHHNINNHLKQSINFTEFIS
jgi:hypothetical protein